MTLVHYDFGHASDGVFEVTIWDETGPISNTDVVLIDPSGEGDLNLEPTPGSRFMKITEKWGTGTTTRWVTIPNFGPVSYSTLTEVAPPEQSGSAVPTWQAYTDVQIATRQPLSTMLTKLAALASTLTDGQLIKWDATLGEPVAMNPVGNSRIAAAINGTGVTTSMLPGASGGTGAVVVIPSTAISVTNSNGRNVIIRFGASFNQTIAGTGGIFTYLRETTAGNTGDRKIMVTPLTGSATSGNTFVTNTDEFDIGVVTTTRTFELRAGLFTPSGQTPAASVFNSATSPTWIRADAA